MTTGYECKTCGRPVVVLDSGQFLRACDHTGAVLATMRATTTMHTVTR